MSKVLGNLGKTAIALAILTVAGLFADYYADRDNFPGAYTLFPLSLLIVNLLVMLVVWLFHTLIQNDR